MQKIKSYKKYFPFKTPRQEQTSALDFALASFFNDNYKYAVLELPTGVGKSAIAVTLSQYFGHEINSSDNKAAYILTTQKILQEQYIKDFPFLSNISAKNNYPCIHRSGLTCDIGLKIAKAVSSYDNYKEYLTTCAYREAKRNFDLSEIGLTNLHYFLSHSKYQSTASKEGMTEKLEPRKLLVIDEAHNLESIVTDFAAVEFTKYYTEEYLKMAWPNVKSMKIGDFMSWIKNTYSIKLVSASEELKNKISTVRNEKEFLQKYMLNIMKKLDEYTRQHESIINVTDEYSNSPKDWIMSVSSTEDKVSIKPLYAKNYTRPLLFSYGEKVLLMSGTILNKEAYCENVGIPSNEASFLSLDSPFPVKNRPVFFVQVGSMARKNITATMPNMIKSISQLLEHHKSEKGIIHAHTYDIAKYISDNLFNDRLLFHSSTDRIDVLQYHLTSSKPTVLVSPSFTEGIDLVDDSSRFQIIVKCMFPYIGDAYVKTKMDMIENWYNWQTIKSIIQASGRSIRHDTDTAITYILDSDFLWLYNRNKKLFPKWWSDSIQF